MLIIRSMSPMRLSYLPKALIDPPFWIKFCLDFEFWFFIFSHGTADNFLLDIEGNKTWNIESLVTEVDPKIIHFIHFWILNLFNSFDMWWLIMMNGLCLRSVTYRFWLESLRYSSLRLAGLVRIDKNMFMDPFQNQGKREQLQHEIDFKGGQIFHQDCCKWSRPHVHHPPVELRFQASKMFSSVLLQVDIFKKSISHSCQTNFENLSSWICILHCGGRVTLFAGGLTQALICKTSKQNCSDRLISRMMLNASKYKTTRSHRLLLKSWQNVTQLQIYRTFIFWLRWWPSPTNQVLIWSSFAHYCWSSEEACNDALGWGGS